MKVKFALMIFLAFFIAAPSVLAEGQGSGCPYVCREEYKLCKKKKNKRKCKLEYRRCLRSCPR